MTNRYAEEAKDMKAQIMINNRKCQEYERDLQEAISQNGGMVEGGADSLRQEILDMQR